MVSAILAFVAPPLIVCGIVCLVAKRRVLLKCAWAAYLTLDLTARIFTGIGWQSLPGFLRFLPRGDLVRLRTMPPQVTIAALQLIGLLLLIVFTVRVFRGAAYAPTRANKLRLAVGWAIYALRWILPYMPPFLRLQQSWYTMLDGHDLYLLSRFVNAVLSYAFAALLTALLIRTRAFLQANKK